MDTDDIIKIEDFDNEEADVEVFPGIDLIHEDIDNAPQITESEEETAIAESSPDIEEDAEKRQQMDDGVNRMISLIKDLDFDAGVDLPKDIKALGKSVVADKKNTGQKPLPKRKLVKKKLSTDEDLFSAVSLYHAPPDVVTHDTTDENFEPVISKGKAADSVKTTYSAAITGPTQESAITEASPAETPTEPHKDGIFVEKHPVSPVSVDNTLANRPPNQESVSKTPDFSPRKSFSETIPEISIKPSADLFTSGTSSLPAKASEQDVFLQTLNHSLQNIFENENFDIKLEKVVTQMVKKKMGQKKVGRKLANAFEECILKGVKDFKET